MTQASHVQSVIADLQIHSRFSRAVSQKMDLAEIAGWAAKKGIGLVATGDWTHPLWFEEICRQLVEVSPGIFRLKGGPESVKFLLSTELSSIYRQGGRGRRVHNLLFSPSLETCEKIIRELVRRGANLQADGRPIVGISSKDLLELVLGVDDQSFFIPAHIWTPWFGLLGDKSGFDSLEECFGELAGHIHAIETGLSSDPSMNWRIAEFDTRSIVSFSDAHSGPKLGREATVFLGADDFSYADVTAALRQDASSSLRLGYTIEFFPEEGKYHWTGHRACGVCLSPEEEKLNGPLCPVCGRPLTGGVEQRVARLANRDIPELTQSQDEHGVTFVRDAAGKRLPFVSMVPLVEIAQAVLKSPTKATRLYEALVAIRPEFEWLLTAEYSELETAAGAAVAQAVRRVRERRVSVHPGYDGVFGTIRLSDES